MNFDLNIDNYKKHELVEMFGLPNNYDRNAVEMKGSILRDNIMNDKNVDCIFGSRWSEGGKVIDYPIHKRIINRIANMIIRLVMNLSYNDTTNAFKLYKKEVIGGIQPILSPHFNLTIELPLKAIIRGYTYTVIPNSWTNRKYGVSKLKIKEMGSRYFYILMYCFIEKHFSRGDFKRKN